MITGQGSTSIRKLEIQNQKISSLGYVKTKFAHKAAAGATGINLSALTTPPEMATNGFQNPTSSQIASANLLFYRNNLRLTSSLRGLLEDYVSYTVAGSTQINFVGFTAQEGEIFVGTIDYTAVSGLQVVSATGQPATGVLAAGTNTFNIGYPIPTNQYSTTQLGGVLVYLDGVLQTRNTGNSSTTLDGNYYELDNGSGNFSQIVFNVIDPINARNVLVVPNGLLVPQPDGSLLTTVQAQAGQINQLAQYVASLTGQSTTTVLGGAASYTDLLAFGNLVNSINNSYANITKSNTWTAYQNIPGRTDGSTVPTGDVGESFEDVSTAAFPNSYSNIIIRTLQPGKWFISAQASCSTGGSTTGLILSISTTSGTPDPVYRSNGAANTSSQWAQALVQRMVNITTPTTYYIVSFSAAATSNGNTIVEWIRIA